MLNLFARQKPEFEKVGVCRDRTLQRLRNLPGGTRRSPASAESPKYRESLGNLSNLEEKGRVHVSVVRKSCSSVLESAKPRCEVFPGSAQTRLWCALGVMVGVPFPRQRAQLVGFAGGARRLHGGRATPRSLTHT